MYPSAFKNAVDLILRLRQNLAGDLPEVENQDRKGGLEFISPANEQVANARVRGTNTLATRRPWLIR